MSHLGQAEIPFPKAADFGRQSELREVVKDRVQANVLEIFGLTPRQHTGDVPTPKGFTLLLIDEQVIIPNQVRIDRKWGDSRLVFIEFRRWKPPA